ncbi:MAG: cytochrome c-type biogenesis protein [Pseudomonadota bacterium]
MRLATGCIVAVVAAAAALAANPDERLDDPVLEERARAVGRELRCVVCQSQSIEDSDAPLAQDLRKLVRERISAGDTNKEALDYIAARYGDYVLLRPPVRGSTFLLWAAPAGLLVIAGAAAVVFLRRKLPAAAADPQGASLQLTEEERARLIDLEQRAEDA